MKKHSIKKSRSHWSLGPLIFSGLFSFVVVVGFIPPVGDIINGLLKEADGCRVWQVVDGDTVRIWCHDGSHSARILSYDTPELRARCPSELRQALVATYYLRWLLWKAKKINTKIDGTDRYGRKLVLLYVDGKGVAREMVNAGLARWYNGGHREGWCG